MEQQIKQVKVSYDESALYKIMWDVYKENCPCLCPVETPTGSGKTTAMLSVIIDAIQEDKKKKIFLISTKNNDLDDAQKALSDYIADRKILRLRSISDTSKEFIEAVRNGNLRIPLTIKNSDEYKQFFIIASDYAKPGAAGYVSDALRQSVNNAYRSLRKYITRCLDTEIRKEEKGKEKKKISDKRRKKYISDKEEWGFLYTLFPSMRISQAQVIIMTVDKFYYPLVSVTQHFSRHFYEASEYFKDSVIFFDESDSDASRLKDLILNNAAEASTDIINVFTNVWNSRHKSVASLSEQSGVSKKAIEPVWKDADRLYQKYHVEYPFQTDQNIRNEENNMFLFKSSSSSFYDREKKLCVHYDKEKGINRICGWERKGKEDHSLIGMAWDLYLFLSGSVLSWLYDMADGYWNRYPVTHPQDKGTITYADSFTTVMKYLGFDDETMSFFKEHFVGWRTKEESEKVKTDNSFFEKGFTMAVLSDDRSHNENSEIRFYLCKNTPEKIIAHMAESASVFMVSATALNESVIKNVNFRWLHMRLGKKLRLLTVEEDDMLTRWLEEQNNYKNVDIRNRIIGPSKKDFIFSQKAVMGLFPERFGIPYSVRNDFAKRVYYLIRSALQNEKDERSRAFKAKRYLALLDAYRLFVSQDDTDSFLAFGNAYLKENKPDFDVNTVIGCSRLIDIYYRVPEKRRGIYNLKTTDEEGRSYDQQKEEIDSLFREGKELFIYTVYQASGVGQNLQHSYVPNPERKLYKVNKKKKRDNKKDYDAVYVMNPTHVIETGFDEKNNNFLKSLYQAECLHDPFTGELTDAQEKKVITAYFSHDKRKIKEADGVINKTPSAILGRSAVIVQAFGRGGRTCLRNKTVYSLLDHDAAMAVAALNLAGHHYTREMEGLIKYCQSYVRETGQSLLPAEKNRQEGRLCRKNTGARRTINFLKKRNPETGEFLYIKEWKKLREGIMKKVQTKEEWDMLPSYCRAMYQEEPGFTCERYTYDQHDDYQEVNVSLDITKRLPYEMSEKEAFLDDILMIPGMKDYFVQHSYRTNMRMENYILTPVAFNNIYKGAIAEIAGEHVLHEAGVETEEITDPCLFELFDEKIKDTDIYVDYKNYKENGRIFDRDILFGENGGLNKARKCEADTIIYIKPAAKIVPSSKTVLTPTDMIIEGIRVVELPGLYVIRDRKWNRNEENFKKLFEVVNGE